MADQICNVCGSPLSCCLHVQKDYVDIEWGVRYRPLLGRGGDRWDTIILSSKQRAEDCILIHSGDFQCVLVSRETGPWSEYVL